MSSPLVHRIVLLSTLLSSTGMALASDPAPAGDRAIRSAVAKAIPGAKIEGIGASVIPGLREVAIDGKVVYASADGRYLLQGSLVELETRHNLTTASEGVLRRGSLDAIGAARRIVFSPPRPRHRVTVFTDIDCGYCRKLHAEIAGYNQAGIAVEYVFYPRAGTGSEAWRTAVSVWCAGDRRQALTEAKAGRPVPVKTCANPVADNYEAGRRIGIPAVGTPAVYAADGSYLGGYVKASDLLQRLERRGGARSKAG